MGRLQHTRWSAVFVCASIAICGMRAEKDGKDPAKQQDGAQQEGPAWQEQERVSAEISTQNKERGNWFLKSQFLKKARESYKRLRKTLDAIESARGELLENIRALDTKLDSWHKKHGIRLQEVEQYLQQAEEEQKQRSSQEAEESEENDVDVAHVLHDIKVNIEELQSIAQGIKTTTSRVAEQWEKASSYEEKSFADYEKIESHMNDKVAKQLYADIESASENMSSIKNYFTKELKGFTETTKKHVDELLADTEEKMKTVYQASGIALGAVMKDTQKKDRAQAERKKKERAAEKEQQDKTHDASATTGGFFARIAGYISSFFHAIFAPIRAVGRYIGSLWTYVRG